MEIQYRLVLCSIFELLDNSLSAIMVSTCSTAPALCLPSGSALDLCTSPEPNFLLAFRVKFNRLVAVMVQDKW